MRWSAVLFLVLVTALPVSAEDWTTADGKTYRNVVVIAQEDDGIRITYTGGVGKLPYYELSLDLQKRFGEDFDSLEAKRKAAEKALAEATRNAAAASAAAAELKKQQDEAAAALAKTQPGTSPTPSSAPLPPPAAAGSSPIPPEQINPWPGSKFSYDESADICYLDSPVVDVWLVLPEAVATDPNSPGHGTLALRIATEGKKPETPDQIEVTFLSSGIGKKAVGNPSIKFLVDGAYIPVTDFVNNGDGSVSSPTPDSVTFYLSPEQMRSIFKAKNVNFSVGSNNYRIDDNGIALCRKYFADLDHLPPASTNFVRAYNKFINRLPSIVTVISTVCEYIILSSFAILLAASIAAFVLGISRFIKM